MFHNIPKPILERMAALEAIDARDRQDGTPRKERLRQVPPETGRFLALLAANAPEGQVLEIGTSAGYSALWLSLACRQRGDRLVTFEILEEKARRARETFALAEVEDIVGLIHGDALEYLPEYKGVAFCFLDSDKEIYAQCYEMVIPKLVEGGFFVADNFISHQEELKVLKERALVDERVDGMVVSVGKGLLMCQRLTPK